MLVTFIFNTFSFKISYVFDVCWLWSGDFMDKPVDVSINMIIEGNLEVKLRTIWTDEKHRQEETRTWRK